MTIIPFELTLDFMAKWKRGIGSKHGHTQDLKSEFLDVSVNMKECQGAINFDNSLSKTADFSSSNVLSNLKSGAMMTAKAHKGN